MPHKAIFLNQHEPNVARVFAGRRERIEALLPTRPGVVRCEDLPALKGELAEVEVAFSTWGMPSLDAAARACLPKLKAVFYAAGSVKGFAEPLLTNGIAVSSAWQANALPVAEYTLAHIILALKQTFQLSRSVRADRAYHRPGSAAITGTYGSTVGLIALGAIGRRVVELLKPFDVRVIAYDPYAKPTPGIEFVGLDEVFARADVVSLHAPWIPATEGMITGAHLRQMKPWSTFINTSRGKLVREDEMIAVLRERPDLQAVLDVTWPEPPAQDSALYDLPNVLLAPHIAGSAGNEVHRMADWMIEECQRYLQGEPLRYGVTVAMLPTMA
jgi:phosphoglycerate dehydrogenase-like enzyme